MNYVLRRNSETSPGYEIPEEIAKLFENQLGCQTGGHAKHGLRWEYEKVGVIFFENIRRNHCTIYICPTSDQWKWKTIENLKKIMINCGLNHLEKMAQYGGGHNRKHLRVHNVSWKDLRILAPELVKWVYTNMTSSSPTGDVETHFDEGLFRPPRTLVGASGIGELSSEILNVPMADEIDGWCTVKTMATKENITVQALYYRIKKGVYDSLNLGGVILVKPAKVISSPTHSIASSGVIRKYGKQQGLPAAPRTLAGTNQDIPTDNQIFSKMADVPKNCQDQKLGENMSKIITRPAALVNQGKLKLYATSLTVGDLLMRNFYSIERLDPDEPNKKGYQRLLNKARAKKLADYLIEGQDNHDAFLPTSIFLATDKDIQFDPNNNTITFDTGQVGPFSVVDGQHRIEGLRFAAEKKPELSSFEVPVNIAPNLPNIAQMCHFLIVNTTQKSVDKAVEQRIYARLTQAMELEEVPNLPKWVQRIVESGDDEQALIIVDYLNETDGSPWLGKIEMANQESRTATIKQKGFVKSIKRYVLTANNPIFVRPPDQQKKIFFNYWRAIANLLDSGKPTVLFKYNGVELFSRFSTPIFNKLLNIGDFKVSTIEKLLKATFENVEGDYAAVGHPDWWLSVTGPAGRLNPSVFGKICQELTKALHKVESTCDIQV